jgi:tritrans,polycis-undecaprenyl-diphosphate synthase [geranylgeranyl-diphosphate specific]
MSGVARPNFVAEESRPGSPQRPFVSQLIAGAFRDAQERRLLEKILAEPVPKHLAIIMDGNRRFALGHGMLIKEGHVRGKETLETLLDWCLEVGIRILTVYALSTENLQRPAEELGPLMDLFADSFRQIVTDERVHKNGIQVRAFGHVEMLRPDVTAAIRAAEAATAKYSNYRYNVAIAYGGRQEILDAIRSIAEDVAAGRLRPQDIISSTVSNRLYTAELPDPDLVFRTSGEERISNFLLWQTAYAELYFADVMWPGLTRFDFFRAIRAFQERQRRFGE